MIPMRRREFNAMTGLAALGVLPTVARRAAAETPSGAGLTAVAGLEVGHFTDARRPTGCTVVLARAGVVCAVDVRGGAPGTRETDLLDPVNLVDRVHAVVLSGGSAFGLDAASGVMRFLDEQGIGFPVRAARVPIVPAAILYDLDLGDPRIRPDAAAGYAAARSAAAGLIAEGNVGAGTGCTVGKLFGPERAMKSGLGTVSLALPGGLVVGALAAVNAVGDVVDPASGRIVAGARSADGRRLENTARALLSGALPGGARADAGGNTTLGIVATNARFTKTELTKIAQMAQDGVARSVSPAHTPWDGDTVFALATGTLVGPHDVLVAGALAAEALARAIVRAAEAATGLPGLPASRDLA